MVETAMQRVFRAADPDNSTVRHNLKVFLEIDSCVYKYE
jgi:hypothetical protein